MSIMPVSYSSYSQPVDPKQMLLSKLFGSRDHVDESLPGVISEYIEQVKVETKERKVKLADTIVDVVTKINQASLTDAQASQLTSYMFD